MRQPVEIKNRNRQQIARVVSQSAPVRGWNARDGLANMKPGDAVYLVNWFPTNTEVVMRGGNADHLTGVANPVKTLAVYNKMTGTSEMYAATDAGIYNASSAGAVGASVATSTNGYWQPTMFGDGTNNWLIMANGVDKPNYYNGASWIAVDGGTSPALTGITTTDLVAPFSHKGRLYFIEINSLSFWYLAAGAAGGSLTEFNLASIATRGGFLLAGGTWSVDSGEGPDDRFVVVTSEGEVIVYVGTNPGDATAWSKVGTYFLGKPLGRRCLVQLGGDLVVLTEAGAFPLSKVMQSNTVEADLAVSDRIRQAFGEASILYRGNVGWEGVYFPARQALVCNIPTLEFTTAKQYVMNTNTKTGAWCEFEGWNAMCFAVFNNELYFGGVDGVQYAWTGTADDGLNIEARGKEAFGKFGTDFPKMCSLYRPILQVNGSLAYSTGFDVDFKDTAITGDAVYSVTPGSQWDVDNWDEALWAASLDIIRQWQSPKENYGTWFAGKLKVATSDLEIKWLASDIQFQLGQGLGGS